MRGALARWRGTVAYVILAVMVAVALNQNRTDSEDRTRQAKAAVVTQTRTLRASCEDRNGRDRRIAYGLAQVVANLDADADDVAPIIEALAPRDCERLYPMPE